MFKSMCHLLGNSVKVLQIGSVHSEIAPPPTPPLIISPKPMGGGGELKDHYSFEIL